MLSTYVSLLAPQYVNTVAAMAYFEYLGLQTPELIVW